MCSAARAVIVKLWQETPSVRGVRLQLADAPPQPPRAGQWLDFIVPSLPAVGGYSFTQLGPGTIDLCVKRSQHPCATWVHDAARVGDQVSVRVGGSFGLAPDSHRRPCLFVAGGIGITPLACMLAQLAEQRKGQQDQAGPRPVLLYSASSPDEFACLAQLLELRRQGSLDLQLFTTQQHGTLAALQQEQPTGGSEAGSLHTHDGRISPGHLAAALQQQGAAAAGVMAYVCGPPAMTEQVQAALQQLGVLASSLMSEKWW